jgi:hypothetical protein
MLRIAAIAGGCWSTIVVDNNVDPPQGANPRFCDELVNEIAFSHRSNLFVGNGRDAF